MADTELLVAEHREGSGTRMARRLRRQGLIPAVLYGHKTENVPLTLRADQVHTALRHGARLVDVKHAGETEKVLVREVQWDTFGKEVLHVDLTRVSAGERITVEVPIELRGTAPGVKEGGRLAQNLHALEIECLATAIPDSLRVNVNDLHLNQTIHVSDLDLPAGVVAKNNPETVVVQVSEMAEAAEAPAEEHAAVEPELIRKEKAEGEAEG
jgi:large subunit ribosomal protein L25